MIINNLKLSLKIVTGKYKQEKVETCPLCHRDDYELYDRKRIGVIFVHLKICHSCGMVFQSPRLTPKSLKSYYNGEYRAEHHLKGPLLSSKAFEKGQRRGNYIFDFLRASNVSMEDKIVYEYGCGFGGILDYFKSNGCVTYGCDLDRKAVEYGKSRGLDLHHGDIQTLESIEIKPDIVILSHLLEHIADPHSFLKRIRKIMKADSCLYIEVPGSKRPEKLWKRTIQPGHLMYFDLETLKKMVQKCGFSIVKGNEIVQALFNTDKD